MIRMKIWKAHDPIQQFLVSCLDLVDAIIGIVSLGFFGTSFGQDFIFWYDLRRLKRKSI